MLLIIWCCPRIVVYSFVRSPIIYIRLIFFTQAAGLEVNTFLNVTPHESTTFSCTYLSLHYGCIEIKFKLKYNRPISLCLCVLPVIIEVFIKLFSYDYIFLCLSHVVFVGNR